MHTYSSRSISVLLILSLSAIIAACGGGGGSNDDGGAPPSPPPQPAVFTVGGTVSGLAGTVVLQDNRGDELPLTTNTAFTLARSFNDGSAYSIAVKTHPLNQSCSIANASGTISGRNVTDVSITCATNPANTFSIGGRLSGAHGAVVLANSSSTGEFETLSVVQDGPFEFPTPLARGKGYLVTLQSQPAGQRCMLANNAGTVGESDIHDVDVTCETAPPTTTPLTVGGTVSGLVAPIVISLETGSGHREDLALAADNTFTFLTPLAPGESYLVLVKQAPGSQSCEVRNFSGNISDHPVTNVQVVCQKTFAIEGAVTGLAAPGLVLQNNARDDIEIGQDGHFVFNTRLLSGERYEVTVANHPFGPTQTCEVVNGTGTVVDIDVATPVIHCATEYSRFALTANELGDSVSLFTLDSSTGQLRHRSRASTGDRPLAVAIHPTGEFAYIANRPGPQDATLSSYKIARDGSLSALPGGDVPVGARISQIAMHPSGAFAYAVGTVIRLFAIEDGQLHFTEDQDLGDSVETMLIQRSGRFAYLGSANHIKVASIASDARLTLIQDVAITSHALPTIALCMDRTGRFVYALQGDALSAFRVLPDGMLEPNGTLTTPRGSGSLVIEPSGRFLYFDDRNTVAGFEVDRRNGHPVRTIGPWEAGPAGTIAFNTLDMDPAGRFLVARDLDGDNGLLVTFAIDATTGELAKKSTVVSRDKPIAMALSAGASPVQYIPGFAHTLGSNQNSVSTYRIDAESGAVAATGTSVTTGPDSTDIAVDTFGRVLYVARQTGAIPGGISAFEIDQGNPLTFRDSAEHADTFRLAVDPANRAVYATGLLADIQSFGTTPAATLDEPGVPVPTGNHPSAIALEPNGRFAYVTNADGGNNIVVHSVKPDGSLDLAVPVRTFQAGLAPVSAASDPSGQYLYVANAESRTVSAFAIAFDGALVPRTGAGTPDGTPTSVVAEPAGRFVYAVSTADVADPDPATRISQFRIRENGSLEDVGVHPVPGLEASALLKADPSGRFVYLLLGSENLLTLAIDANTGALQEVSSTPVAGADSLAISGSMQ